MKQIATMALMLNLGIAALYAQRPLNMTFSGTGGASVISLQQPGTTNVEESEAGALRPNLPLFFEGRGCGRNALPGRKSIEG